MTTTELEYTITDSELETYDEQALVQRVLDGDTEAFAAIYSNYRDVIQNYLERRCASIHLAEDITQETFIRALNKLDKFQDLGKGLAPWLTTLAHNTLINHIRSKSHRERANEVELVDNIDFVSDDPAEAVVDKMAAQAIKQAIQPLAPASQIDAILTNIVDGVPADKYAESIGAPLATVRTRIHKGRKAVIAAYGTSANLHAQLFNDN